MADLVSKSKEPSALFPDIAVQQDRAHRLARNPNQRTIKRARSSFFNGEPNLCRDGLQARATVRAERFDETAGVHNDGIDLARHPTGF